MIINPPEPDIHILVTGKPGIGKPTLVDGLFGKEAKANCSTPLQLPGATCVQYKLNKVLVTVTLWQFPKEELALEMKKSILEETHLLIVALRMDDARMRPDNINMIQKLSQNIGDSVWEKVVFVFTFANEVSYLDKDQNVKYTPEHRTKRGELLEKYVKDILKKERVSDEVVRAIPFVPAGHPARDFLKGDEDPWMGHLVRCIAGAMDESAGNMLKKAVSSRRIKLDAGSSKKCNYLE